MDNSPSHASGRLASLISAEVRATMARTRVSGAELARLIGVSQNYLSKRLRDEAPLTLNDTELICDALGDSFEALVARALHTDSPSA